MAAPIPSNLLFVSAGIDFLQSNPLNWVLQSDGVTPALRVPVATDTASYQDVPSDTMNGFNLDFGGFVISGTGNVLLSSNFNAATLLAGGSTNLLLGGLSGGLDFDLVGLSPSSRLIFSGNYSETGDGSGNIQKTNFTGDLDVENLGASYDSIEVGGDFTTINGDMTITNIEVMGNSFADDQHGGGSTSITGIFHGLATITSMAFRNAAENSFFGVFLGGQALSDAGGFSSTLYDQQYIDLRVKADARTVIFPMFGVG